MTNYVVCALYKFVRLEDYKDLQEPLKLLMDKHQVRGTLLLANEGINGTVASDRDGINALLAWFKQDSRLADIVYKESYDQDQPFHRTKVKLKKEICTGQVQQDTFFREFSNSIGDRPWFAECSLSRL